MDIISVGAEYGGPDIPHWLIDEQIRLNRLLRKHCRKPYNPRITSFILALRVEGSLKSFGFTGIDDVRVHRSRSAIGADISVQRADWETDLPTYRSFLWRSLQEAIWTCVGRLKQNKLIVDESRLHRNLVKVEREFLAN